MLECHEVGLDPMCTQQVKSTVQKLLLSLAFSQNDCTRSATGEILNRIILRLEVPTRVGGQSHFKVLKFQFNNGKKKKSCHLFSINIFVWIGSSLPEWIQMELTPNPCLNTCPCFALFLSAENNLTNPFLGLLFYSYDCLMVFYKEPFLMVKDPHDA